MKKLISIILSLALVACMFGMSAMAADHTVGGTDGTTTLDPTDVSQSVTLNLAAAQSRYAVDITFGGTYELGVSGLVWDVNSLQYVANNVNTTISDDLKYDFEVVNWSDNAITVQATYSTANAFTTAGLSAAFSAQATTKFTDTDITTATVKGTLAGNVSGTAIDDVSKVEFSAEIASGNWETSINNLIEAGLTGEQVLATFTITVGQAS